MKRQLRTIDNGFRSIVGLPPRRKEWFIEFVVRNKNAIQFCYNDAHQSRQEATMHMLLEALKTIKYEVRKNRKLILYTSDRPQAEPSRPVMSYSAVVGSKNVLAVPDFSFWNWPDVGIADYSETTEQMMQAGEEPPEDQRLFWIGNVATNPVRGRLLQIASEEPRILATDITWVKNDRPERYASEKPMRTQGENYVSLPEHCRYKYLVDIEGIGYSARLKLLLFSRRPVFLQDRPWREFYFDWMKPFRHYIPVARDLSDLSSRLDWAEAHPEDCQQIAATAQAFAKKHLTRDAAILHLRQVIRESLA